MTEQTTKSEELGLMPVGRTLPILLVRAREVLLSHWRDVLTDMGFTEQQWRVLRVTAELGPLDISKLSEETALHMPSVTRILRTLEEGGFVSRRRDEMDSRRSWIDVTDKTREKMAQAAVHSDVIYKEIGSKFEADKMNDLIKLLNEFTEIRK
ncbi:homoprotocatechuate degradation operon regulator HpaR [Amylibacter sp. IMCC11727]|uniref:homoprotocatechuate degradation operon regulator HpaR n=1 Tax=Amylibacter sp. IMCC11727 TaxID=3039851 RepID=UPI00244E3387|nr:homoprotocatechuate degradation operon regulator HpaR [Amylibacter sp. IMCC11727]WGI22961.1 homoprotocatechuate degradation operon regulator HpaR [Amylibacter sp. IMCC11727]